MGLGWRSASSLVAQLGALCGANQDIATASEIPSAVAIDLSAGYYLWRVAGPHATATDVRKSETCSLFGAESGPYGVVNGCATVRSRGAICLRVTKIVL